MLMADSRKWIYWFYITIPSTWLHIWIFYKMSQNLKWINLSAMLQLSFDLGEGDCLNRNVNWTKYIVFSLLPFFICSSSQSVSSLLPGTHEFSTHTKSIKVSFKTALPATQVFHFLTALNPVNWKGNLH